MTGGARSGTSCCLGPRSAAEAGQRQAASAPLLIPHRVTALRVFRELAWFRVRGYGVWVKWGRGRDLHTTRKTAHYLGPLRWKALRP